MDGRPLAGLRVTRVERLRRRLLGVLRGPRCSCTLACGRARIEAARARHRAGLRRPRLRAHARSDGAGHAAELRAAGRDAARSRRSGTSMPPQSPVAWSTFITGLDPGAHGIFDFIHRDPKTMTPYLSTTRTEPPGHPITSGQWQFPLSSRPRGAAAAGPAVLGAARGTRHRDDDHPDAGQLPAVGHGDARAERAWARRTSSAPTARSRFFTSDPSRVRRGRRVGGGTIVPRRRAGTASSAARSKVRTSRTWSSRRRCTAAFAAHVDATRSSRRSSSATRSGWCGRRVERLGAGELRRQAAGRAARANAASISSSSTRFRALRQPAQPRSAGAGAADLDAGRLRRRPRARDRPVLHAGHARGHQGPQDRRALDRRVPAAGAHRAGREPSAVSRTCSISSTTACSSTTSATSTRSRT